jgi:alkanesulfonate monooxygenase SsuD/methylene tetrahydromethanopterin reductase-like flavin-dependent oxidoreductase (luciferase family)
VGVQLPEVERVVRWPELRDMAQAAEAIGFDSLWVGDHLLYRSDGQTKGPWEAWSVLAALAATTNRIEIGPLVAATSFHSPAMLAKKAATVHEISGGRLILGLGAGWNEAEYRAFGFGFDHRASRFVEAFTIIRALLGGEEVTFEGSYYRVEGCVLDPTSSHGAPPLMIGSNGPRVLRATLPYVDMWNTWHAWYGNALPGLTEMVGDIDRICTEVGRSPGEVAKTAAVMVGLEGGTGRRHGSPGRPTSEAIYEPPEQLAVRLRSYAATGVSHVQLVLDPITIESIEALEEVLAILDAG